MLEPWVVAIGGPSGAGKTHLVQAMFARLPPGAMAVLQVDDYYRDLSHLPLAERALQNFDHPDAIEYPLLAEHLGLLRTGRAVDVPLYDFATHTRKPASRHLHPAPVMVVEGILALHWPAIRDLAGLRVYVDAPDPLCFSRRLDRDARERQRTPQDVLRQYEDSVRPMCDRFVRPSASFADVLVPGDGDVRAAVDRLLVRLPARVRCLAEHSGGTPGAASP